MRSIISLLTAATLLIEGTAGWCCHPPGHDEICGRALSDAPQSGACCEYHQRATDEGTEVPVGPCQGKPECHGICVFMPPQKSHLDGTQAVCQIDHAAMLPTLAMAQLAAASFGSASRDPLDAESPVRLHLLHRLLLI